MENETLGWMKVKERFAKPLLLATRKSGLISWMDRRVTPLTLVTRTAPKRVWELVFTPYRNKSRKGK